MEEIAQRGTRLVLLRLKLRRLDGLGNTRNTYRAVVGKSLKRLNSETKILDARQAVALLLT